MQEYRNDKKRLIFSCGFSSLSSLRVFCVYGHLLHCHDIDVFVHLLFCGFHSKFYCNILNFGLYEESVMMCLENTGNIGDYDMQITFKFWLAAEGLMSTLINLLSTYSNSPQNSMKITRYEKHTM